MNKYQVWVRTSVAVETVRGAECTSDLERMTTWQRGCRGGGGGGGGGRGEVEVTMSRKLREVRRYAVFLSFLLDRHLPLPLTGGWVASGGTSTQDKDRETQEAKQKAGQVVRLGPDAGLARIAAWTMKRLLRALRLVLGNCAPSMAVGHRYRMYWRNPYLAKNSYKPIDRREYPEKSFFVQLTWTKDKDRSDGATLGAVSQRHLLCF